MPASKVGLIDTYVNVSIPFDCYGRVAGRSSLAMRFIDVDGGVINSDYTGTIRVVIYNFSPDDFCVKEGDRIAQLVIERIFSAWEVTSTSTRGNGGFVSSDFSSLV